MAGLTLASPSAERRVYSPWRETWRRYSRHKLAVVSAFLLLILVLAVVVGPFIWRVKIDDIDIVAGMQGPSLTHPFGTDDLGQDILARMIYGGRISLAVGLAAMLVSVFIGVLIGALFSLQRASFSDPDHNGPWTVTIDWGDGNSNRFTASTQNSSGRSRRTIWKIFFGGFRTP